MSIIENVTDRISGETVAFERKICGVCQRPVYSPDGHSSCTRIENEKASVAAAEWNRKQQLRIEQGRLEVEKNTPKTPAELRNEKLEAEPLKWQRDTQKDQRKQRLAELEAETANLRRLLDEEAQ